MKRLTRRAVLRLVGALTAGLSWRGSAAGAQGGIAYPCVEVERAGAFAAPYLKASLIAGRRLDVVMHRGRVCMCLEGRVLGWLPHRVVASFQGRGISPEQLGAFVERMALDRHGRLRLFVTLRSAA